SPLALTHGPVPMRSRAFVSSVLRYAAQDFPVTPAASARDAQWASAPASLPRFAPSPRPRLVTKKLIEASCAATKLMLPSASTTEPENASKAFTGSSLLPAAAKDYREASWGRNQNAV